MGRDSYNEMKCKSAKAQKCETPGRYQKGITNQIKSRATYFQDVRFRTKEEVSPEAEVS